MTRLYLFTSPLQEKYRRAHGLSESAEDTSTENFLPLVGKRVPLFEFDRCPTLEQMQNPRNVPAVRGSIAWYHASA
jgi:hypothetical protein